MKQKPGGKNARKWKKTDLELQDSGQILFDIDKKDLSLLVF